MGQPRSSSAAAGSNRIAAGERPPPFGRSAAAISAAAPKPRSRCQATAVTGRRRTGSHRPPGARAPRRAPVETAFQRLRRNGEHGRRLGRGQFLHVAQDQCRPIRLRQGLDSAREVVPQSGRHGRRLQAVEQHRRRRWRPEPHEPPALARDDAEQPSRNGGCRAQRTDLPVQCPKRVLDGILRVLRAAAGPARDAAQVRPGLGQQPFNGARLAAPGRLDQLTTCPCRHLLTLQHHRGGDARKGFRKSASPA